MKSILYVGATLMIGASIYGFVDYKKTSQKQGFAGMYETKEVNNPVPEEKSSIAVEKTEVVRVDQSVKKPNTQKTKVAAAKTMIAPEPVEKISSEIVSGNTPTIRKNVAIEKIPTEIVAVRTPSIKENVVAKNFKPAKKRKLNTKLFSRAPLREEYLEKEVKPVTPKKEIIKEQ